MYFFLKYNRFFFFFLHEYLQLQVLIFSLYFFPLSFGFVFLFFYSQSFAISVTVKNNNESEVHKTFIINNFTRLILHKKKVLLAVCQTYKNYTFYSVCVYICTHIRTCVCIHELLKSTFLFLQNILPMSTFLIQRKWPP